jgi:hypothetical protein
MTLHTQLKHVDAAKLEGLVATLERTLAAPLPAPDYAYAGLAWLNRRNDIFVSLDDVWAIDEATATTWVPNVLADAERWPDERRVVSRERFDRIGAGKATPLDTLIAPAFRAFKLASSTGSNKFRPQHYARFFAHPIASELRRIDLSCTGLPAEAAALIAAADLPRVTELSLDRTDAGDAGVEAVARAFPQLRALNLYMCKLGHDGLANLGAARFAPTLEALAIGGNQLGIAIVRLAPFSRLAYLSVRVDPTVDAASVRALLESPHLPSLRTLDLHETSVDAAQASELAALRPGLTIQTEWTPAL